MFKKSLDALYTACGVLACVCLLMTGSIIIAQILSRLFGILVPSADEFAGYAMAMSTFLGLAYTFRANGHIRVTLFTQRLQGAGSRRLESFVLFLALLVMGYFTWYNIDMAYTSYDFGDISTGLVPMPLWIPQTIISFGTLLMTVSILDELLSVLKGDKPRYALHEESNMQGE
jgi:TRAP-type C4-dicarboxylate transport system permease small subunit